MSLSPDVSSGNISVDMHELVQKYSQRNIERRKAGKPLSSDELINYLQKNLNATYSNEQIVSAQGEWIKGWIDESEIEKEVPKLLVDKITVLKKEILQNKKDLQKIKEHQNLSTTAFILVIAGIICYFIQSYEPVLLNFKSFSFLAVLESILIMFGSMFISGIFVVAINFITEWLTPKKSIFRASIFGAAFLLFSLILALNLF